MAKPAGTQRPLKFPLNRSADIESDTPTDAITIVDLADWATTDPDERINVVLNISLNEYVAIASAVDVGRDIAYGDNSIFIWWLWVRGLISMDICQTILDCINNTKEIQQAIASYALSSAIDPATGEQQNILDTDIFGGQGPCSNDNIYGMTVQLTAFLNQTSEDVLEIIVTGFSTAGRLGDIIEAIPIVGELPFDDILQFAEKMAVQVNNAYQAAYDIQLAEDISCDLFCIAQQTCSLTLEQARDYFKSKLLVAVTDSNWATIANDIIANNWIGEQSVYMTHWMILDTIIFGGEILGIDVNRTVQTIASYFNDPNPDWATLCTVCSWSKSWLGGNGDPTLDGWVLTYGVYDAVNDRLNGTFNNQSSDSVYASFFVPTGKAGTLTKFTINYDVLAQQNTRTQRIQFIDEFGVQVVKDDIVLQSGTGTLTITGNFTYQTGWEIRIFLAEDNRVNPHYSRALSITVEGTGDNIFL